MVRGIIQRIRARIEGRSTPATSPADGEPVPDGGSPKTVCSQRAHAWAGVYAAAFDVDAETGERAD